MNQKYVILYISTGQDGFDFESEYRQIEKSIPRNSNLINISNHHKNTDASNFHTILDQSIETLVSGQKLIVHLAGHGDRFGFQIKGAQLSKKSEEIITPETAREYFENYVDNIACIIFSSCRSVDMAKAVSKIPKLSGCIGLTHDISDKQILDFTKHFYEKLNESDNLRIAFEHAKIGQILKGQDHYFWGIIREDNSLISPMNPVEKVILGKDWDNTFREVIIDLSVSSTELLKEVENSITKDKYIDQKFLYLETLSVKKWKDLIDSDTYTIYKNCSNALQQTLKSKTWIEGIRSGKFGSLIDLGVGAGQKDNKIFQSFLKITRTKRREGFEKLRFVIIDSSYPMIELTLNSLKDFLEENSEIIDFRSVKGDFMKLGNAKEIIRVRKKSAAFFMLGCTFCNIKENTFLLSLLTVLERGDLLILGIEILSDEDDKLSESDLTSSYDNDLLRKLVLIPLRTVESLVSGFETDVENIVVEVSGHRKYSEIENTANIVIKHSHGWELASSSRYHEPDFVKYVEKYGFSLKEKIKSLGNKFYRHYIFEFTN